MRNTIVFFIRNTSVLFIRNTFVLCITSSTPSHSHTQAFEIVNQRSRQLWPVVMMFNFPRWYFSIGISNLSIQLSLWATSCWRRHLLPRSSTYLCCCVFEYLIISFGGRLFWDLWRSNRGSTLWWLYICGVAYLCISCCRHLFRDLGRSNLQLFEGCVGLQRTKTGPLWENVTVGYLYSKDSLTLCICVFLYICLRRYLYLCVFLSGKMSQWEICIHKTAQVSPTNIPLPAGWTKLLCFFFPFKFSKSSQKLVYSICIFFCNFAPFFTSNHPIECRSYSFEKLYLSKDCN